MSETNLTPTLLGDLEMLGIIDRVGQTTAFFDANTLLSGSEPEVSVLDIGREVIKLRPNELWGQVGYLCLESLKDRGLIESTREPQSHNSFWRITRTGRDLLSQLAEG